MKKLIAFFNKGSNKSYMLEWEYKLKQRYENIQLIPISSPLAKKATIAMLWKPSLAKILKLDKLESIISLGQGVDHIINFKNFPKHLNVYRIVDPYMAKLMSHWVILSVLSYIRDYEGYRFQQKSKIYKSRKQISFLDVKIGIYGIGAIGNIVANDLSYLGFHVLGWSRTKKKKKNYKTFFGNDGFLSLNKIADIHISLLPLTRETKNIFDREFFSRTKKGICFINAGRGGQLVEKDILEYINTKKINLVVLDVFKNEPLPKNHEFWDNKKIVIWPHVSAETNIETAADQVAHAIKLIHLNKTPKNKIDLNLGY